MEIINISSVKIPTPGPLCPDTDGDGGGGVLLSPRILLKTKPSQIQYMFKFLMRQHNTV